MRTIYATLSLLVMSFICTASNFDFNQRYGPDSHIYNTPLYFKQRTIKECKKNYGIQTSKKPRTRNVRQS